MNTTEQTPDLRKLADDLLTRAGRALARFNTSLFSLRASSGSTQHDDALQVARYNVGKMAELLEEYAVKHREWRASLPQGGSPPPEPKKADFYLLMQADGHSFKEAREKAACELLAITNMMATEDVKFRYSNVGKNLVGCKWQLVIGQNGEEVGPPSPLKNELGTSCFKHIVKLRITIANSGVDEKDVISRITDEIRWTAMDVQHTELMGHDGPGKFVPLNTWIIEQEKL